ncbi:MAG: isocitrate lyase/PEP mutase family protein [Gammaproteobacteria bacterium]|nr:isocitrate lyase/PEP mutase family protein [Gammaproteobacteria bacterium]MDH3446935.1 isocitrate lyase/PEP mutase family protein [Gammaproteobacteria bacterium]
MNTRIRRQKLREIFDSERCIHPGSVFDPISARIAEDLGFEAGMFAGSIASLTVLGAPDIIVLTLTEFANQAHRICRAGELPLIVDADHGYGNALNVKRTVEELETAGIACLTIEDTLLPRRFGASGAEFLSIEEGVGKMKAALAGRQDPDLIVLGRTSAVGARGVDEGIRRARAYLDAGVDGIMFVGIKTRPELEAIAAEIDAPIMLGGSGAELQDAAYLAQCGVRISLQGHQPFMAAVQALHDTLKALRDGTPPADLQRVASSELMDRLTRDASYQAWQEEFLN